MSDIYLNLDKKANKKIIFFFCNDAENYILQDLMTESSGNLSE